MSKPTDPTRRDVLKKATYVAPLILTFPASPAFAQKGVKLGSLGSFSIPTRIRAAS